MAGAELCEPLPWDSDFFGVSIARAIRPDADAETCNAMRQWCVTHRIACLYFLCPGDESATRLHLEAAGFKYVGSRVTLERSLAVDANGVIGPTRAATVEDVPRLRAIAATSHRDTRFYIDGRFDPGRCDDLYAAWIENSVHGYADVVIVVERDAVVVGYVTVHTTPADTPARIGLIAVAADSRNQGAGRDLVRGALRAAAARGARSVSVVTAGTNAAALALYASEGFRTTDVSLWYHAWFSATDR